VTSSVYDEINYLKNKQDYEPTSTIIALLTIVTTEKKKLKTKKFFSARKLSVFFYERFSISQTNIIKYVRKIPRLAVIPRPG